MRLPTGVAVARTDAPSAHDSGLWTFEPSRGWWIEGNAHPRVLDHGAFARLYPHAEVVADAADRPHRSTVALLRVPIPVRGGLAQLAEALDQMYDGELILLPFDRDDEFAKVVRR